MKFIDNIDINHYTDFILQNDYCTIFQSPEWTQIKDNWDFKRVGVVDDNDNLLATAQILIRKGMWYLPRGPLLDYNNTELLNYFLENLAKYARKNKAKLVKIDIPKPLNNERLEEFNKESENLVDKNILNAFKSNKFSHRGLTMKMSDTIQPRFNAVTILEDFPEKLPKHTKRLLKDVDKRFVEVRQVEIDKLDDLMFVLECTENRKNISLRNREYFKKLMELYKERALVYIAYLDIANALAKTREKKETLEQEILKLGENMHKKRKTLEDQFNSTKKLIEFFESFNSTQEEILCGVISIAYGKNAEMLYAGMNDK
uniref:peptidoglycan bridge formation glycyltransferase FemA/FemB family protein n=1 Tax=uncultured Gemella sp. TaxID=254352 RepID=UPI0028E5DB8B